MLSTQDSVAILKKLNESRQKLVEFWQTVLPLNPKEPANIKKSYYSEAYAINEKTLRKKLKNITDEKEFSLKFKKCNIYELSETEHKDLVIALSVLIQIVDDCIDGHVKDRRIRGNEWKPLHESERLIFYALHFHDEEEKNSPELSQIKKIDVGFHLENHARVLGKDDKVIEVIQPGIPRTKHILDTLINPFITSFTSVAAYNDKSINKFCDKLAPADEGHSCINARIRMAIDEALSDIGTDTFSDVLGKAFKKAYSEHKDKNSFFYMLAVLMRDSWGENFKADTGDNAIYKSPGKLNVPFSKILFKNITTITTFEPEMDIIDAYPLVPVNHQTDFWHMMNQWDDFIPIIQAFETPEQVIWLIKEAAIQWNQPTFKAILKKLIALNSDISQFFVSSQQLASFTEDKDYFEMIKISPDPKLLVQSHWRSFIPVLNQPLSHKRFSEILESLKAYLTEDILLKLIQQSTIHLLHIVSDDNTAKLKHIYHEIIHFIENKALNNDSQKIFDALITSYSPIKKRNLLGALALECDVDVNLIINKISSDIAGNVLSCSQSFWSPKSLQLFLEKIEKYDFIKKTLKKNNQLWYEHIDISRFVLNIKFIANKLNQSDLMEVMESHRILQGVAKTSNDVLKVCLDECQKYLSLPLILQMIYRAKIIPVIKDEKDEENINKLKTITKIIKEVAELKEIDPLTQEAFDELLIIHVSYKNTNLFGHIALENVTGVLKSCMDRVSKGIHFIQMIKASKLNWGQCNFKAMLSYINFDLLVPFLCEIKQSDLDYKDDRFSNFVDKLEIILNKVGLLSLKTILSCWEISLSDLFSSFDRIEKMRKAITNPSDFLTFMCDSGVFSDFLTKETEKNKDKLELIYQALQDFLKKENLDLLDQDFLTRVLTTTSKNVNGEASNILGLLDSEYKNDTLIQIMPADSIAKMLQHADVNWSTHHFKLLLDKMENADLIKSALKKPLMNLKKCIVENFPSLIKRLDQDDLREVMQHQRIEFFDLLEVMSKYNDPINVLKLVIHSGILLKAFIQKSEHDQKITKLYCELLEKESKNRPVTFPVHASFGNVLYPAIFSFQNMEQAKFVADFITDEGVALEHGKTSVDLKFSVAACSKGYVGRLLDLYPSRQDEVNQLKRIIVTKSTALATQVKLNKGISFFNNTFKLYQIESAWKQISKDKSFTKELTCHHIFL